MLESLKELLMVMALVILAHIFSSLSTSGATVYDYYAMITMIGVVLIWGRDSKK